MHLKRLTIDRLPGIREWFEIKAAGPGVHIIYGPNGSGKSSICRAVEGLYWADRGSPKKTAVSGEFERYGAIWRAEREGPALRWSDGEKTRASPILPASHNSRCFFLNLRDLVDTSQNGSDDIATEIRRQMSGGFDLDKIAKDLFVAVTPQRTRARRKEFNQASRRVQRARGSQSALQEQVDQLKDKKGQLKEAEKDADRLVHVQLAVELVQCQEKLIGIQEELGAFPGAFSQLTGNEVEHLEENQRRLDTLQEREREIDSDRHAALARREESSLASPLEEADLDAWLKEADDLGRIEQRLADARTDRAAAQKKLVGALSAIGGGSVENSALRLPDHGELFEFLRASQTHATRSREIRERLRLLNDLDPPEASEPEMQTCRSGIDALRSWLRAPPPQSIVLRLRSNWPWFLLASAMVLTGAGLAYLYDLSFFFVSGLGLGIAFAALFLGNSGSRSGPRAAAEARYKELGLEEPVRWNVSSVGSVLHSLETKTTSLDALLTRARDRDVERRSLTNQLVGLKEQGSTLEARRLELQSTLGLKNLPPDAELVDFARALDELRRIRAECEATTSKVQDLEKNYTTYIGKLADILTLHKESRPANVAEAKARLNHLVKRNAQLKQALESEKRAREDLERNAEDRKEILDSVRRIYAKAGLQEDDARGLVAMVERLPKYQELKQKCAELKSQTERDRTKLEEAGESALCAQDGKTLEELREELNKAKARSAPLRDEIAYVGAAMSSARESNTVRDLIAMQEAARAKLRDLREQALFVEAGTLLIDEVEQEYEQNQMPRVFEHARNHFSEFTFHNYELHVSRDRGNPRLLAVELSGGRRRELGELSDGTRAQLLLAARIAFAEEAERGQTLPLFLDEALDQSDPQRFEAIAKSLGCIARDQGRQIFYLTSDPLDVERFRQALSKVDCSIAAEIDLGAIRTSAASVTGPQELRVEPAPSIPAPNGRTPEEYGASLRVPTFRPGVGSAEQHMFYVLWDDLELLHRFLTNGIERAGQWKTVADTPLSEKLGSPSITAAQFGSRLDLMKIFCELWKQGRGKPVDQDALADSNAVSKRYLEDVVAIAKELNGDPERLLDMLDRRGDERLKGFRGRGVERLRSYLVENEYLDDRRVLSESELQLLCFATPAANDLPSAVARECVRRWWAWSHPSSP